MEWKIINVYLDKKNWGKNMNKFKTPQNLKQYKFFFSRECCFTRGSNGKTNPGKKWKLYKNYYQMKVQFSSVQSLSRVRLFATPGIAAHQASLFITVSRSSLRLMSIESMMPSSHLILGHPLLLLPPISPSIRVFSNESKLLKRV